MRQHLIDVMQTSAIDIANTRFDTGHGTLPSVCAKCKGPLDFARKDNDTILKCRKCSDEVKIPN
jgi:hypothetical protein